MSQQEEKKSIGERIEDGVDEAVYHLQNAIYGEPSDPREDIPASLEDPSGYRRINKFGTRRNIGRWVLRHPKTILIALGVIAAVILLIVLVR